MATRLRVYLLLSLWSTFPHPSLLLSPSPTLFLFFPIFPLLLPVSFCKSSKGVCELFLRALSVRSGWIPATIDFETFWAWKHIWKQAREKIDTIKILNPTNFPRGLTVTEHLLLSSFGVETHEDQHVQLSMVMESTSHSHSPDLAMKINTSSSLW